MTTMRKPMIVIGTSGSSAEDLAIVPLLIEMSNGTSVFDVPPRRGDLACAGDNEYAQSALHDHDQME